MRHEASLKHPGIAHVILQPALSDAQRPHQGRRDHAHLVPVLSGDAGQSKRLGAGLDDHPRRGTRRQPRPERPSSDGAPPRGCPPRCCARTPDSPCCPSRCRCGPWSVSFGPSIRDLKRPATSSLLIRATAAWRGALRQSHRHPPGTCALSAPSEMMGLSGDFMAHQSRGGARQSPIGPGNGSETSSGGPSACRERGRR